MAAELVGRCVRAFPVDAAPGPSGLRVQHLKDAGVAGSQDVFFSHLAGLYSPKGRRLTLLRLFWLGPGWSLCPKQMAVLAMKLALISTPLSLGWRCPVVQNKPYTLPVLGAGGVNVPPGRLPLSLTSATRSTLFAVKPCCLPLPPTSLASAAG